MITFQVAIYTSKNCMYMYNNYFMLLHMQAIAINVRNVLFFLELCISI